MSGTLQPLMPMDARAAPIGIFDSGIGGLSVLRHVQALLPQERLLYFADSGYAPYGDKSESQIIARSLAVAHFLVEQGVKALVVACNTATAAAIEAIRQHWPQLIVVGIEPGLKPAALHSKSGVVGVLATRSTLASARFIALRDQIAATGKTCFLSQACVGLVDQIEKGELCSVATIKLVDRYVLPLIAQGADTLVLGCTHYPFVRELIEAAARRGGCAMPLVIDTGEAVVRQLARLMTSRQLMASESGAVDLIAYTTASASSLSTALKNLLKVSADVREIVAQTGVVPA
jgi:glutamate racemase